MMYPTISYTNNNTFAPIKKYDQIFEVSWMIDHNFIELLRLKLERREPLWFTNNDIRKLIPLMDAHLYQMIDQQYNLFVGINLLNETLYQLNFPLFRHLIKDAEESEIEDIVNPIPYVLTSDDPDLLKLILKHHSTVVLSTNKYITEYVQPPALASTMQTLLELGKMDIFDNLCDNLMYLIIRHGNIIVFEKYYSTISEVTISPSRFEYIVEQLLDVDKFTQSSFDTLEHVMIKTLNMKNGTQLIKQAQDHVAGLLKNCVGYMKEAHSFILLVEYWFLLKGGFQYQFKAKTARFSNFPRLCGTIVLLNNQFLSKELTQYIIDHGGLNTIYTKGSIKQVKLAYQLSTEPPRQILIDKSSLEFIELVYGWHQSTPQYLAQNIVQKNIDPSVVSYLHSKGVSIERKVVQRLCAMGHFKLAHSIFPFINNNPSNLLFELVGVPDVDELENILSLNPKFPLRLFSLNGSSCESIKYLLEHSQASDQEKTKLLSIQGTKSIEHIHLFYQHYRGLMTEIEANCSHMLMLLVNRQFKMLPLIMDKFAGDVRQSIFMFFGELATPEQFMDFAELLCLHRGVKEISELTNKYTKDFERTLGRALSVGNVELARHLMNLLETYGAGTDYKSLVNNCLSTDRVESLVFMMEQLKTNNVDIDGLNIHELALRSAMSVNCNRHLMEQDDDYSYDTQKFKEASNPLIKLALDRGIITPNHVVFKRKMMVPFIARWRRLRATSNTLTTHTPNKKRKSIPTASESSKKKPRKRKIDIISDSEDVIVL
ncbi:hypothetical protein SAMD00019534_010650 [Acytostelium subglobosum LB1]|uniref:hypothetical protein n=1 Tax=Acytostelium subglobosum LB1 TaxID=1410327 RepID=UPI0006451233|nr:hypothetical protein SAMD00019534_010650 [Acytostelium subglobosum LB1]GAM17890.1 hypothetical protein SAMD00019534_010650 [Acytostelium subglobosum LB1]|eukprot:XP_012758486.1 hypothetical protein SAMD00019534_010650 [Acytostelium subglobosum LB1]